MVAPEGRFVFFFNQGEKPAGVRFARALEKPAARIRELSSSQIVQTTGPMFRVETEVPGGSIRVYRIDF